MRWLAGGSRHEVLSLWLPAFVLGLGASIAAPALPVFAKSFDVTFGVAALVLIAHVAGSAAATIPTGYLVDRFGRRKIVLAGPLLTALSSFLIAGAQSFPELLVYRFLGGWAVQMWLLGRLTMVADSGGERRGRQITGMYGMDNMGRLLGPAVGGLVAAAWDVRVPFLLHGLLALAAIIPSFVMLRETAPSGLRAAEADAATASTWRTTLAEMLVPGVLAIVAVQFLASMTRGSMWDGTLDLYVVYAYGLGPGALGLLVTATSAIGIPITLTIGHLMDRVGRKPTLVPGLALLGGALLLMAAIAWFGWPFASYVLALFLGRTALSMTSGAMQVLASDVAPVRSRGRFLGIWRLVGETGMLLSPVTFALLAEHVGFAASFLFIGATGLGAALLLGVFVKETLATPQREAPASA